MDYRKTNISSFSSEWNNKFQLNYYLKNKGCIDNKIKVFDQHLKSKAIYDNKVVDSAYFPRVYGKESVENFKKIVQITTSIINKVMDEYFENPEFRNLYKWDKFSEKLINFKPKYSQNTPIMRIDLFCDERTKNFSICEFNTGGTAAQSEVFYLGNDAENFEPFSTLKIFAANQNKTIKQWELYKEWVKNFILIYNEWAENTNHVLAVPDTDFNIAIVDFLENSQLPDFELFKNAFLEMGYKCSICDIRELTYRDGKLLDKSKKKIDALYKRATLNDVIPLQNDPGLSQMIEAVFNDDVCPIDWFSTQLVHDKQISYILHDKLTKSLMTNEENEFIKKHIPVTYRLTNNNWHTDEFIANKDNYIVKPLNGRRSKDIFSGKEYSTEKWTDVLKTCAKIDNFIIQRFCRQYTSKNIALEASSKDQFLSDDYQNCIKNYCNMDGLYCYNQELAGVWLRQGDHSQDSTKYNITCPTFYVS